MSDLRLFPEQRVAPIDGRVVPPTRATSNADNTAAPGGSSLDALSQRLNAGRRAEAQRDRAMHSWLHRSNRAHAQAASRDMERRIYMGRLMTR